ncbi:lipocalin family protein [Gayadomonas joobiniege]|uniref:lipocalin family protein n=1 Tax=Gayadomonas joobiniege TaxID=1234606 RepID=UPI0003791679|nr:lipocalin family protein [Gayadomonas joobiniege]
MKQLVLCAIVLLAACTSTPSGIQPVDNFNLSKYLGKWYEIARYDHSFEEGLRQVTAEYSLKPNGDVKVINRGFDPEESRWQQAEGKAHFVDDKTKGHLAVSFFGPFYSSYVIFSLDNDYQTALVTGPDRDYFWILSRSPKIEKTKLDNLIQFAESKGFERHKMVFVEH